LNPATVHEKGGKILRMRKNLLKKRLREVEVDLRLIREKADDSVPLLETRSLVYEAKAKLDQLWAELFDVDEVSA
jgi:hypothetical protein